MNAAPHARKVAVITGTSQGIGAGLAAGYRQAGYAVVGVARSMLPSDEQDYLTIQAAITEAETAQRVVDYTLDRFGRVDTLVNNAGIYIGKPFTDYTLADYLAITEQATFVTGETMHIDGGQAAGH
jgi:NAD(P)-dependent dehydrogenase (short-subunit alcohol dehydrogenase family)